ncbi:MAG TPA: ABC transporter permease, partial [Gammaproteobacteria bacterium]|nr:ABC transporter permease [Gammaproteobacteria bacterium]
MAAQQRSIQRDSPAQRAWRRFKNNKRGYYSLWVFGILFVLSLLAEVISNDRPVIVSYQGEY